MLMTLVARTPQQFRSRDRLFQTLPLGRERCDLHLQYEQVVVIVKK